MNKHVICKLFLQGKENIKIDVIFFKLFNLNLNPAGFQTQIKAKYELVFKLFAVNELMILKK